MRNAADIQGYSIVLAQQLQAAVQAGEQALVIEGDCSILLGCVLGLKVCGQYGLFFLDGHTYYQGSEHSGTAGAHGPGTGNGPW
ncbi:hypothetical protein DCM91_05140 [Chitinophaga costaii]|uniref:hypothetical protein n=1 Tax=Chitinophaga costaii TaxID=1335309 RepID=UPI000B7E2333|nr:hypothetical protein [Chitinophaga costaii]PUZ27605.1 hypothetical protein DCM91_05140 [Chitinophaga costaii]